MARLLLSAALLLDTSGTRRPPPVVIVTDVSWKAAADAPDGWTRTDFCDADWRAARLDTGPASNGEHYSVDNLFGGVSTASWIWQGAGDVCHFRRAFEAAGSSCRAEMAFVADDEAEIWINGERVLAHTTAGGSWGLKGGAELLDLAPFLRFGRNVIAVRAKNNGGPCGFAAELRVGGEPFFYPLRDPRAEVPEWARERIVEPAVLERYGWALLPHLRKLSGPKPRLWIERLAPDMNAAGDDRCCWRELTPAAVKAVLREDGRTVAIRWLAAMRALAAREDTVANALREALGSADVGARTRAARYAAALLIPSLESPLAALLRDHPRTPAAAFAAVALGRMGVRTDELRAALSCGYAPTERAARHALRLLR